MIRNNIQEVRAAKKHRSTFSLLLGDAAIAAWLCFAFQAFTGRHLPSDTKVAAIAIVAAVLAWGLQLHRIDKSLVITAAKSVVLAAAVFGLGFFGATRGWLDYSARELGWLAGAFTFLGFGLRVGYLGAKATWPEARYEFVRWLALGAVSTGSLFYFYRATTIGSGDAYWYTIMLADFTAQMRAGVFPIWAGQSEFAFNGAVSPLRLAPWFQYMGGLLDYTTCHALNPAALKNAVIAVNGIVVALSAYGSMRIVIPRRPELACITAALWVIAPGVLTPLMIADMIMTFMAMVFLPIVVAGAWLVWTNDGLRARVVLALGLAGTWLSHTPVALWCTLFAAVVCLAKFGTLRAWPLQIKRGLITAGIFIVLGILPIASVLSLDNMSKAVGDGWAAAENIDHYFPGNFLPLLSHHLTDSLYLYQLGYVAIAAFAAALVLMTQVRPRGSVLWTTIIFALSVFILPVPFLTETFWHHAPGWFVTINNIWPMQRLFGLWAFLMFFLLLILLGDSSFAKQRRLLTGFGLALSLAGLWSVAEAAKLARLIAPTRASVRSTAAALSPTNVLLTRYSYTSFRESPGYFSHGYMDPVLENRLLNEKATDVLVSNADVAAPPVQLPVAAGILPRLVAAGELTAKFEAGETYFIASALPLASRVRHALRLEINPAVTPGVLLALDPDLSRQYLLPDSGQGVERQTLPQAFGSLASNSRVIPLQTHVSSETKLSFEFIGNGTGYPTPARPAQFTFGRYWLYRYANDDLPIQVKSLLPYHVVTHYDAKSWLETPRMWLGGYRATVNGKSAEVERSPNNLAMIKLPAGLADVTLSYVAPAWLTATFWMSTLGWLTVIGVVASAVIRRANRGAHTN